MRRFGLTAVALVVIGCVAAGDSGAQMPIMVEPGPELPGDRAMSCEQLAREMGAIMKKRNMNAAVKSSKSKICRGQNALQRQAEERQRLMNAQTPQLTAASVTGGPAAAAIYNKTQAEQMALEARQQAGRQQAVAELNSGMGDMVGVMNDPRIMRLGMLAMAKNCAATMAPPEEEEPAAVARDACDNEVQALNPAVAIPPAGGNDPFVKKGAAPAKPSASDPFEKR